jgi:hypothetical protein
MKELLELMAAAAAAALAARVANDLYDAVTKTSADEND